MIKNRFVVAAVTMFAILGTSAQAGDYRTFKRDGVTYTYRVIEKDEHRIIVGKSEKFGFSQKFTLTVKNGQVNGNVGDSRVAFAATDASNSKVMLASD